MQLDSSFITAKPACRKNVPSKDDGMRGRHSHMENRQLFMPSIQVASNRKFASFQIAKLYLRSIWDKGQAHNKQSQINKLKWVPGYKEVQENEWFKKLAKGCFYPTRCQNCYLSSCWLFSRSELPQFWKTLGKIDFQSEKQDRKTSKDSGLREPED